MRSDHFISSNIETLLF